MRRHLPLLLAAAIPAPFALALAALPKPLVLVNPSPSVAIGLYVRAPGPVAVGRLLAFRTPIAGRRYAHERLPELDRGSILKPVVAGPGALACATLGRFSIDGRVLGAIAARDRLGHGLPRWTGCRRLGPGEYMVFSDRIWNSFDSRYFGPVTASDIIGVYEPLWIGSGPGRPAT